MDVVECLVIGAGVVGLAVSRELALRGHEVVIVEAAKTFGSETSSRNSEVIHAGIYYPQGSLKASLCVSGREQLYAYARARDLPFSRCGKLIVATSDAQTNELERIKRTAERNGVADLQWLDAGQVAALEPDLATTGALLSPSTGIIDSHAYMRSLLGEAEGRGAVAAFNTRATQARLGSHGMELGFDDERSPSLRARVVVNAAGLHAQAFAGLIEDFPSEHVGRTHFAKGSYFGLAGRNPFRRLVYPVPQPGGLGVHLTLDLAGQARFGPDVEWTDTVDYEVDPDRASGFYEAIRAYWPGLPDGALTPAYAGIRPKLGPASEPASDFYIGDAARHGVRSLVNLFGIESPGLTSSLALASLVADRVEAQLD